MANLHASLDSTCKSRISKISTRCQILGGSIPQPLILTPEMNLKKFSKGGAHSTEWAHSQDLTLFPFCCVHHHRSFLTKDQKEVVCNSVGDNFEPYEPHEERLRNKVSKK